MDVDALVLKLWRVSVLLFAMRSSYLYWRSVATPSETIVSDPDVLKPSKKKL